MKSTIMRWEPMVRYCLSTPSPLRRLSERPTRCAAALPLRRLSALPPQRTFASATNSTHVTGHPEFTISPYRDNYELGYGHGTQFCVISLLHSSVADQQEAMRLYERKVESAAAQVDELFRRFDTNQSGALDDSQLREAMAGIGLPPNEERVRSVLVQTDENQDGQLQKAEFAKLLRQTWGGPVSVNFTKDLPSIYPSLDAGQRAFTFVGRSVPTHFVLRALRNLWPHPVESVAIMRNAKPNPTLDPALMEVFDETYAPSVPVEVASAASFARAAAFVAPTEAGGFVVRIIPDDGGEPLYVLLRGMPENFLSGNRAKPAVGIALTSATEWIMRTPLPAVAALLACGGLAAIGKS